MWFRASLSLSKLAFVCCIKYDGPDFDSTTSVAMVLSARVDCISCGAAWKRGL